MDIINLIPGFSPKNHYRCCVSIVEVIVEGVYLEDFIRIHLKQLFELLPNTDNPTVRIIPVKPNKYNNFFYHYLN